MCILHKYHKASRLKSCTARGKWGKYIRQIYFIISRWRRPVGNTFFSSGALADVKECKIITLKYTGKACRLYLLYSNKGYCCCNLPLKLYDILRFMEGGGGDWKCFHPKAMPIVFISPVGYFCSWLQNPIEPRWVFECSTCGPAIAGPLLPR